MNKNCVQRLLVAFLLLFSIGSMASDFDREDYVQLTNIPSCYIETFDHGDVVSKIDYKYCRLILVKENVIEKYDSVQIRGRGNASWNFEKKPYRIKFKEKQRLLGKEHANARSWVLLSNGGEKLLFRNGLANFVSKLCKMPFTPSTEFIDLYLNGEFKGNYQITDFVEIRKHRVDIEEMEVPSLDDKTDITGGYLLEVDYRTDEGKTYIKSPIYNNNIRIHSPEPENINKSQIQYIRNKIGEFEETLISDDYTNPQHGWYQFVDSASFMGWYLTNEICSNCDMFAQIYFYKQRDDDKFYFSPIWDFDLGFNDDNRRGNAGDVSEYLMQDIDFGSKYYKEWFDRITTDPWWIHAQYEAFKKLYVEQNLDSMMNAYVDSVVSYMKPSIEENYKVWSISKQTHLEYKLYSTYDQYVEDLRSFIKIHNAYIFNEFKKRIEGTNGIRKAILPENNASVDYMLSYNKGDKCLHFLSSQRDKLTFRVNVFSLTGKSVGKFSGSEDFDVRNLPNGTYIVSWKDGKRNHSVKFVKK